MKDRIKDRLAFTFGLLLAVVAMYLFIGWEFRATDAVAGIIFVMGVAAGVWGTKTWYGIGRR